jgi:hypothetical protein
MTSGAGLETAPLESCPLAEPPVSLRSPAGPAERTGPLSPSPFQLLFDINGSNMRSSYRVLAQCAMYSSVQCTSFAVHSHTAPLNKKVS